jgi:hypothetical protein
MKGHKLCFRGSIYGLLAGTLLSWAYLLFGRWDWYAIPEPEWAKIAFFPGVAAGHLVYDAGWHSILACEIVGIGTMGMLGATIGCGAAVIVSRRKRAEADNEPETAGA